MWQDLANFLIGIWLFLIFKFGLFVNNTEFIYINLIFSGSMLLVFSIWVAKKRWPEWINFVMGILLIVLSQLVLNEYMIRMLLYGSILISLIGIISFFMWKNKYPKIG